jgi:hypothetical protein
VAVFLIYMKNNQKIICYKKFEMAHSGVSNHFSCLKFQYFCLQRPPSLSPNAPLQGRLRPRTADITGVTPVGGATARASLMRRDAPLAQAIGRLTETLEAGRTGFDIDEVAALGRLADLAEPGCTYT